MSAELIVAHLVLPDHAVDWEQMFLACHLLPIDDLSKGAFDCGQDDLDEDELREWVLDQVKALKHRYDENAKDLTIIEVPYWDADRQAEHHKRVLLAGGMTWGDDPSESFTVLSNVAYFPTVLEAGGFR
jgi:hypothetical protein